MSVKQSFNGLKGPRVCHVGARATGLMETRLPGTQQYYFDLHISVFVHLQHTQGLSRVKQLNQVWRSYLIQRLRKVLLITHTGQFNILVHATTQGAPGCGGVRTCGGLKSGFPTLQQCFCNFCHLCWQLPKAYAKSGTWWLSVAKARLRHQGEGVRGYIPLPLGGFGGLATGKF